MHKKGVMKKWHILAMTITGIALVSCLTVAILYAATHQSSSKPTPVLKAMQLSGTPANGIEDKVVRTPPPEPVQIDGRKSLSPTNVESIWVVVNKSHPLHPQSYVPSELVPAPGGSGQMVDSRIAPSLQAMITAAGRDGVVLTVVSAYRSYNYQVSLYNSYVAQSGQALADNYSARPGHSEHQTGLAVDMGGATPTSCVLNECFGETPAGKWIAAHASEYGFIIRYQNGKEPITGYKPEPWHLRYVGNDLAKTMRTKNILSLEEYFSISGGTVYR